MKVVFELVVQDANIAQKLDALKGNLKDIQKELKGVDQDSKAFESLTQEAIDTRVEIIKLTEEQKNLKKEFAATQVPIDSLAGLRIEYSKLVSQITLLTKAERESENGQALIKNAEKVKGEINGIQESVGNFTGSVGSYKDSILNASSALGVFGGSLGQQSGILSAALGIFDQSKVAAGAFFDRLKAGGAEVKEGINNFKEYVSGLKASREAAKDASEVTGDLAENTAAAAEGAVETAQGMAESAKGFSLVSTAGKALKTVLASLGIGLIIALVVGLIGVFQKFAPVVDFVQQAVAGLGAAMDVLVSRTALLVSAVGKFFAGDFSGAFDTTKEAVSGMGAAMVDAGFAAAGLTKEMQDLEDAQKDLVLSSAIAEAQVAKLTVSLKNRTNTQAESLKIAAQLTKIETDNLNKKVDLIDKELDIERRKLLLTGKLTEEQSQQIVKGNFDLARALEDQFILQADQTDRIRDLLVKRAQTEGESAVLLERVENRKSAIQEKADAARKAAQDKAVARAAKETKAIEDQIKRIQELEKAVRDLDIATITDDFDKQAAEADAKRADSLAKVAEQRGILTKKIAEQKGVLTEADAEELALIQSQASAILEAYQNQIAEIEKGRQKAIDDQLSELGTLNLEITNLAVQNAQKLAEIEGGLISSNFEEAQAKLLKAFVDRKQQLTQSLIDGEITNKQFQNSLIDAQVDFNSQSLTLERERASKIKEVILTLEAVKIEATKVSLSVSLDAISTQIEAEIAALREKGLTEAALEEAITAKRLEEIELRKAAELATIEEINAIRAESVKKQVAATAEVQTAQDKVSQDELKNLEEQDQKRKGLKDAILSGLSAISGAIFEIQRNNDERRLQAANETLDAEYEKKKAAAQGNADQLAKIDADYQKKKDKLEKEAAEKRKKQAIIEAVIQGALAVVKALPNVVLAALAAVVAAAQIAVISSQTFAKGGIAQFAKSGTFGGRYHSQGGTRGSFSDGTNVEVEKDEVFVILNRKASRQLAQLSALNHANGGSRFADGGTLDFTPQFGLPGDAGSSISIYSQATFSDEQINLFAQAVANETAQKTQVAVIVGLDERNRTAEREVLLDQNSEV